jgi:hypothetical protein
MNDCSQAGTAQALVGILEATTNLPNVPWLVKPGELTATVIHRDEFDAWCEALDVDEVTGPYKTKTTTRMSARGHAGAVTVYLEYRDGDL